MSLKEGHDGEQHEIVGGASPSPRPTSGQRIKGHYKKWWWLHLIIFIIVTLVLVLPIVYVAYPKIAQDGINKAKIAISLEKITSPGTDSANMTLVGMFLSNSSYHPELDAFNASYYLEGSDLPFVSFETPAVKGSNGTQFTVQQHIQITDVAEFTKYCIATLQSKALTVYLRGRGGLKQGSLPKTTVNYNVSITSLGLNGLEGLVVTEFALKNDLPYSANSVGSVTIPNASPFALDLGNVTMNMYVADTFIGNATLPNLNLTPGNSSYTLYATANQTAIVTLLKEPQYQCAVLPVVVKGNGSTYNGVEVPYFTAALQENSQTTVLNLTSALNGAGFGFLIGGACAK